MWVSDLLAMGYEDTPVIAKSVALDEPCIGTDALRGVYFHPSDFEKPQQGRQGRVSIWALRAKAVLINFMFVCSCSLRNSKTRSRGQRGLQQGWWKGCVQQLTLRRSRLILDMTPMTRSCSSWPSIGKTTTTFPSWKSCTGGCVKNKS